MATFEYNPLADNVTVKYECPNCGHINENTLTKEIKGKKV